MNGSPNTEHPQYSLQMEDQILADASSQPQKSSLK